MAKKTAAAAKPNTRADQSTSAAKPSAAAGPSRGRPRNAGVTAPTDSTSSGRRRQSGTNNTGDYPATPSAAPVDDRTPLGAGLIFDSIGRPIHGFDEALERISPTDHALLRQFVAALDAKERIGGAALPPAPDTSNVHAEKKRITTVSTNAEANWETQPATPTRKSETHTDRHDKEEPSLQNTGTPIDPPTAPKRRRQNGPPANPVETPIPTPLRERDPTPAPTATVPKKRKRKGEPEERPAQQSRSAPPENAEPATRKEVVQRPPSPRAKTVDPAAGDQPRRTLLDENEFSSSVVYKLTRPYELDDQAKERFQAGGVHDPADLPGFRKPRLRITSFVPVCYYRHNQHHGEAAIYWSSNDNDLSCMELLPDFSVTPQAPTKVSVRMFESFTNGWGPVCVGIDKETVTNIFCYVDDKDDIIRGLLSGTHVVLGHICWDRGSQSFGTTTIQFGRLRWKATNCPGHGISPNTASRQSQVDTATFGEQQVGGLRHPLSRQR
ncbi:hypothetical protein BJ508DRAFT_336905 [Ascobolus immersus RN42]|uniref:Uncharacterized protein n=1 Tax=Ascobolus immersus RN42 TaxID=1160509 RepID=A0A3N4HET5_ASCIM|nr:hypothetical protein BJ508DRAFT_336905 [Ascobolus immersus RN42]